MGTSHPLTLTVGGLMVSIPLCLVEELKRALPHHPTSSRRWDVRPRGAGLGEEEPGTWCMWIQTVGGGWWAQGESGPLKSHEEACAEWAACLVESGAGT
jgi:hypothetical protein